MLGDDNPRQTGSLLSSERDLLRDRLGFDSEALETLTRTSIAAGFMEQGVRDRLGRQFDKERQG